MINTSSSMMYHIGNLNDEYSKAIQQLSSGDSITLGSEDSLLHKDLIDLDDKLQVTDDLRTLVEKTEAYNDMADDNMSDIKTSLDSIKVDLIKALNAGIDRSDKTALSTNLEGIRETIIDRLNTQVNNEYIFSGSDPSEQTLIKDENYDLNGKVTFGGDAFLREIAVQPDSYRDRGITAYDAIFYNSDTAQAGETLSFEEGERIIDSNGNEWKFNENSSRLQKYDYTDTLITPLEEIQVSTGAASKTVIDLGIGTTATDAKGDYTVSITGEDNIEHTYTWTATGSPTGIYTTSAEEVSEELKSLIEADFPSSVTITDGVLTFVPENQEEASVQIYETDNQYVMTASNKIESTTAQGSQNTYTAEIPSEYVGTDFQAKHNYLDDLNIVINALDGYTTYLDGTRGYEASDAEVRTITQVVENQTISQFDATNVGHGVLGGRNAVFETSLATLEVQYTHYDLLMEEWGTPDPAELALNVTALSQTYEALYSVINKMNDMSLVNYIK